MSCNLLLSFIILHLCNLSVSREQILSNISYSLVITFIVFTHSSTSSMKLQLCSYQLKMIWYLCVLLLSRMYFEYGCTYTFLDAYSIAQTHFIKHAWFSMCYLLWLSEYNMFLGVSKRYRPRVFLSQYFSIPQLFILLQREKYNSFLFYMLPFTTSFLV